MNSRWLHVFTVVYQTGSFSRAAEILGLSQSTISGHLKRLENSLDALLFERHSRKVIATAKAHQFFPVAGRLLKDMDLAHSLLARDDLHGHLGLVAGETLVSYYLPPLFMRYRRMHPGVRISAAGSEEALLSQADEVLHLSLQSGIKPALTRLCLVAGRGGSRGTPALWLPGRESELFGWLGRLDLPDWPLAGHVSSQRALLSLAGESGQHVLVSELAAREGLLSGALRMVREFSPGLGIRAHGAKGPLAKALLMLMPTG